MFSRYLRSCRARGLAGQTIETYRIGLRQLERFLTERRIKVQDITPEIVEDLILWLDDGTRSRRTINSHLVTIRTYLYYEMEQGRISPPFKIKLLKAETTLKEVYSERELELLLKRPDRKTCTFTEYKTWVLENYLLGTGNRLNSIMNITIGDLCLDEGYVILRETKNKKQQLVPLSSGLVQILLEYLDVRGGTDADYLFCNSVGRRGDKRTYQQHVADYNKARGVSKTSIHLFRHTFATLYMRNGGDIYRLCQLLGHSNLGITEHYIHSLPIDVVPEYDSSNPLEQLRNKGSGRKIKMK